MGKDGVLEEVKGVVKSVDPESAVLTDLVVDELERPVKSGVDAVTTVLGDRAVNEGGAKVSQVAAVGEDSGSVFP